LSDNSEEFDGKLLLNSVTKEDDGEYECYVATSGASRRIKLTVFVSDNKKENVIVKEVGGSVELYCGFTNQPKLKWRKVDGVKINKIFFSLSFKTLQLKFFNV
jgi:hypothetical protein